MIDVWSLGIYIFYPKLLVGADDLGSMYIQDMFWIIHGTIVNVLEHTMFEAVLEAVLEVCAHT